MKRVAAVGLGAAICLAALVSFSCTTSQPEPVAPLKSVTLSTTASVTAPVATAGPLPVTLAPTISRPASPDLLALGKRLYDKQCAACHGASGRGNGEAAYLLYPKPRDFVAAQYRLVSTWERTATDEDLFRTISRGMPGSAMPSWGHLSEEERWGLVHYVKSLAASPIVVRPAADPKAEGDAGTGVIRVPPAPPFTAEARKLALERYADACASCHGKTGKGDGTEDQKDDAGFATRPRDLTVGVFKGDPDPAELGPAGDPKLPRGTSQGHAHVRSSPEIRHRRYPSLDQGERGVAPELQVSPFPGLDASPSASAVAQYPAQA